MQFETRHREDLFALVKLSKKEGCLEYEMFRRVESRKRLHVVELKAFESHGPACDKVFRQALSEGKNQQEAQERVKQCSHAHKEQWEKQRLTMEAEEQIYRKESAKVFQATRNLDPALRELIHAKVRAHGLSGRADLNDCKGWVTKYNKEKNRFAVKFDNKDEKEVLLKPTNLTKIEASPANLGSSSPAPPPPPDDDDEPPPLE